MKPYAKILSPISLFLLLVNTNQGCGARVPVNNSPKLTQRIEEVAQQESQNQRQIEELNNRLSLLEDRMDSSHFAQTMPTKPPTMPVIRLKARPTDGEDGSSAGESEKEEAKDEIEEEENGSNINDEGMKKGGRSMVEDRAISYAGAATKEQQRPILRIYGGGSSSLSNSKSISTNTLALAGPDPSLVKEKLPVVPLPKRGVNNTNNNKNEKAGKTADTEFAVKTYQVALEKYKAGQYAEAAEAFRSFLKHYHHHSYSANALYWIGECSYDMKDYTKALQTFRQVVEEYPKGNKTPDAMLKMGYSFLRMKETAQARTVLTRLVEDYPHSNVARLAHQALATIQQ